MPLTPIVKMLLLANVMVFVLQQIMPEPLLIHSALWPLRMSDAAAGRTPGFHIWQLVSYAFLHGSLTHLALNLFALWMFGGGVERYWGSLTFAVYYIVCVIGAAFTQLMMALPWFDQGISYPTIGASGGVFGILLAFGMLFPEQRLLLLFPPIPIKARWLVFGYALFELWMGLTGGLVRVAHFAHLGGMLFGLLFIGCWRIFRDVRVHSNWR